jgi:predicted ABC-type ATPase
MFAGPNGSGKSTIKSVIRPELLGVYINPDEIEQQSRERGAVDLDAFGVSATPQEIAAFFSASTLLQRAGLTSSARRLVLEGGLLHFPGVEANSYYASVIADFLRRKLIDSATSLTLETVMSSPDKVEFLQAARERGFRTYLYFVATGDPIVNISRVQNRVRLGGHPVPDEKIISRYRRSLELLIDAIRGSNRAYIFDNSAARPVLLAEITDGHALDLRIETTPAWFKRYVWDRMGFEADE